MTKNELIQSLISAVNDVPYRDKDKLNELLERADNDIKSLTGSTASYRADLKMIRFSPWSFQSGENEYKTSWNSGRNALINLLNVILNDPEVQSDEHNQLQPKPSALGYKELSQEERDQLDSLKEKPETPQPRRETVNLREKIEESRPSPAVPPVAIRFTVSDETQKGSILAKLKSLFKFKKPQKDAPKEEHSHLPEFPVMKEEKDIPVETPVIPAETAPIAELNTEIPPPIVENPSDAQQEQAAVPVVPVVDITPQDTETKVEKSPEQNQEEKRE